MNVYKNLLIDFGCTNKLIISIPAKKKKKKKKKKKLRHAARITRFLVFNFVLTK